MPNSPILKAGDKAVDTFARNLERVLAITERRAVALISKARVTDPKKLQYADEERFDAAVILGSRASFLAALAEAGYTDVAQAHIDKYPGIVDETRAAFKRRKLPEPKFTQADAETFRGLAQADLERFRVIGDNAMDELRLGLYKDALIRAPFEQMVERVQAATTGTAKNGAPLSRFAYTHANTAILGFGGQAIEAAGKSIGATKWEVVGPRDDVTRPACLHALRQGAMTEAEWKKLDYWGPTPGGWNCRHQLFPALET